MAKIDDVCRAVLSDVGDALACGVVDLNTGLMLGAHHNVPHFTQAYIDAVAAAAVDMFRGKNVKRIEDLLSKQRGGKPLKDTFEEIFISSPQVFHFMKIIPEKNAVVVLVTKKTTNQGMGWAGLRSAVRDVAAAF